MWRNSAPCTPRRRDERRTIRQLRRIPQRGGTRGAEEAEGVWPVSRGIRAIVGSRRANIAMCAFGVPATTVYLSAPW